MARTADGSATRWGPLFGARAAAWAETWEGPAGWGTPVPSTCSTGRRLARHRPRLWLRRRSLPAYGGDRGASVAGIDASSGLIAIAAERVPEGEFRTGDIEALPWADDSFDVVTGFSAFQFADDKVRALREARRVSRGSVAVVIPSRVPESGITSVFKPVFPLFAPEALETMKGSGMFALSEPGKLEDVLASAGLTTYEDKEIDCRIVFADAEAAERAFLGAGADAAGDHELGRGGGRRGGACRAGAVYRSRGAGRPSRLVPGAAGSLLSSRARSRSRAVYSGRHSTGARPRPPFWPPHHCSSPSRPVTCRSRRL